MGYFILLKQPLKSFSYALMELNTLFHGNNLSAQKFGEKY